MLDNDGNKRIIRPAFYDIYRVIDAGIAIMLPKKPKKKKKQRNPVMD